MQASDAEHGLVDLAFRKPTPASGRSSQGAPVLIALVLAASRIAESSIGSVVSTRPVSGRRPPRGQADGPGGKRLG